MKLRYLQITSNEIIKMKNKEVAIPPGGLLAHAQVQVFTSLLPESANRNLFYRSGMVNSNMVNSKFHLIRSYYKYLATILSFHV